jgi:hypothetical protein
MLDDPILEIRSEDDRNAVLRLAYDPDDGDFGIVGIEIRADGLSCDGSIPTLGGEGLDAFLARLAADWRGWHGTRTWRSFRHDLRIEATHRGARVELMFIIRRDFELDAWEVRFPLLIAPGESLSRLARASGELFQ